MDGRRHGAGRRGRWRGIVRDAGRPASAVLVAVVVIGGLMVANHHNRWVPSIPVPSPPTAAPVDELAAAPGAPGAADPPFSRIRQVPGGFLPGYGAPPGAVKQLPGITLTDVQTTNGRVSGLTLLFPPATSFYTVLTLLTDYLPNDARMDFNQLMDRSCRQVQYRSKVLDESVAVPAVTVELDSLLAVGKKLKDGRPRFLYNAVYSATFTMSAIGDRFRHCGPLPTPSP